MLFEIFCVLCNISLICRGDLLHTLIHQRERLKRSDRMEGSPKYVTSCGRFRCVLLIRYRVVNGTIGKFIGGTIDIVICIYTLMYTWRQ